MPSRKKYNVLFYSNKINPSKWLFFTNIYWSFTYALFLNIANKANPNLAKILYKENEIKPFTVSGIIGKFEKRENSLYLSKNNEYYFRITILDSSVFSPIISILLDNNFREIDIGKEKFKIKKVVIDNKENQLTSFETVDDLWSSSTEDKKLS